MRIGGEHSAARGVGAVAVDMPRAGVERAGVAHGGVFRWVPAEGKGESFVQTKYDTRSVVDPFVWSLGEWKGVEGRNGKG